MRSCRNDMGNPTILVAEDDAAIRELLRIAISRSGIDVDLASGGAQAIDMLAQRDYAAVVLDLMMPRGNGYDVVNFLADRGRPAPPVFVLSAAGPGIRQLDPRIVTAVMPKPFDLNMVAEVICEIAVTMHGHERTPAPTRHLRADLAC